MNKRVEVFEMNDGELIQQCEWWKDRLNRAILMVPDEYNYEPRDLFTELLKRFKSK